MAEATGTTRPARRRATGTTAAKPAATPRKAAAKPAAKAEATPVTRFTVELEPAGDTKSYAKFTVPDSYKGTVVGNIYAPLGTERVGIVVIGAEDAEEAPAE